MGNRAYPISDSVHSAIPLVFDNFDNMAKKTIEDSLKTEVVVLNKHGLHLRFAGSLVALTSNFNSDITLSKGRRSVDAKSILDVISLSASQGTRLGVTVSGPDAQQALDATTAFFNDYSGDR